MNAAQLRMYRGEWGKVRKWLRAHGYSPQQADARRHAIHVQELGYDKSSTNLTNPELTKVIRAFKAIYDGGNLDAQMRANDEPDRIRTEQRTRIFSMAEKCSIKDGAAGIERYFKNWFGSRTFEGLSNSELHQLSGILQRRVDQLPAADDGDPF